MKKFRIIRQSAIGFASFEVEAHEARAGAGRVELFDEDGQMIGRYLDCDLLTCMCCEQEEHSPHRQHSIP